MENPFDEKQYSVRPTFLTILCILTLVWNAYKFYGAIPNTFSPETVMEKKDQANEMMMDMFSKYMKEEDLDKVEETQAETAKLFEKDKLVLSGGITLISALLLILGAVWMWGLRKKGFLVYIAGNIVGILAPIIIFGGQIGWSVAIMSFIASAIFTGLYAMNLKYLA
jgi:membrane associated rhomboid family serine protease